MSDRPSSGKIARAINSLHNINEKAHADMIAWLESEMEDAEECESEMADIDREDLRERSRLAADHDATR